MFYYHHIGMGTMRYLIIFMVCIIGMSSVNAEMLCSYVARISEQDKRNSAGDSLIDDQKSLLAVAAAIIRQDRANYHEFDKADNEDKWDCVFADKQRRSQLEQQLSNSKASQKSVRQIVEGNPLIRVNIYPDYVDVSIISPKRSRIN